MLMVITLVLLAPATARSHGIGVEAKIQGDRVLVEAYFDDSSPAADAPVRVFSATGQVTAEGKTDAQGRWTFPAPPTGKYRITVDAGDGHLAKATITIPESAQSAAAVVISDGLTREQATGTRRYLMIGMGLGIIGLATLAARVLTQRTGSVNGSV